MRESDVGGTVVDTSPVSPTTNKINYVGYEKQEDVSRSNEISREGTAKATVNSPLADLDDAEDIDNDMLAREVQAEQQA